MVATQEKILFLLGGIQPGIEIALVHDPNPRSA
jgi:hypothetical protein